MAIQPITTNQTGAGPLVSVASGNTAYIFEGVRLIATSGNAAVANELNASNVSVVVAGEILAAGNGVRLSGTNLSNLSVTVTETGRIFGESFTGVNVVGANSRIVNRGHVESETSTALVAQGANAVIENHGFAGALNSGTFSGAATIDGLSGLGTLINFGTLSHTLGSRPVVSALSSGAAGVVMYNYGNIIGTGNDAIQANNTRLRLFNDGNILGDVRLGSNVGDRPSRVVNDGTIRGDVVFSGLNQADVLRNSGRIDGNVSFDVAAGSAGNNRIDLRGGEVTGIVRGGAGDDLYLLSDPDQLIQELAGEGNDTVAASFNIDLADYPHIENARLLGREDLSATGTAGANRLEGNGGSNRLDGGDGNDVLVGRAGDDLLFGGLGADLLEGGPGADRLFGGDGADQLFGGVGDDILDGGAGNDSLYGGPGSDILRGGAGNDLLDGGSGADSLFGDAGNDTLFGGDGNDILFGGAGSDRLVGGAGNDTLIGGDGQDSLFGGSGNDRLEGGAGNDRLDGGAGRDILIGGTGRDILTGGAGPDVFVFRSPAEAGNSPASRDVITDFQRGVDRIDLSGIDANLGRPGDQAFTFIGNTSFSRTAGELRFANGVVLGDMDGDGRPDFQIAVNGVAVLAASDFIL